MAAVELRLSAYDTLRAELPARVAALRARATVVSGLIADRQGEGYRTTDNDPAPQAAEEAAGRSRRWSPSSASETPERRPSAPTPTSPPTSRGSPASRRSGPRWSTTPPR